MKFEEIPDYIDSLDVFTKAHWWVDYMVRMQSLRHSIWFDIDFYKNFDQEGYNCNMANSAKGYEEIDLNRHYVFKETVKPVQAHLLWKNDGIASFDKWSSRNGNIRIIDRGENWQQNGFAQRIRTDYFGIYDYYIKFILK